MTTESEVVSIVMWSESERAIDARATKVSKSVTKPCAMKRAFQLAICCTAAPYESWGTSTGSSFAHTTCIVYSARIGWRSSTSTSARQSTASGRWSACSRPTCVGTRRRSAHAGATTSLHRANARSTAKSTSV